MKDAIQPNLVQTLGHNPALIHGGPFANIAQGTNSILATKMGLSLGDYVVTEAGFGSDLGAEKFFNLKCREAGLSPKAVVLVATIRALKYHGGKSVSELTQADVAALKQGLPNLQRHLESLRSFGVPVVVAVNVFGSDTEEEKSCLLDFCREQGVAVALSEGWAKGGLGCVALGQEVLKVVEQSPVAFTPTYALEDTAREKITKVARKIYGADGVTFSPKAQAQLKKIEKLGLAGLPICMAKTQKSLSDSEKWLGRPENFTITIREFELAAGAGFIIPIAGDILRMPGLPALPAAEGIDVNEAGQITGLF
jgi:formate--tetrahydrofolate ligase